MSKYFLIIILCVYTQYLNAQHNERAFGLGLTVGNVVKHTPKLYYENTQTAYNVEFNYIFSTAGRRYWHHRFNKPMFGLTATFINSRDSIPGKIYTLMPNIYFNLAKGKRTTLFTRIGTGPAFANNHWRRLPLSDTLNNYLGGTVNMYASVLIGLQYRLTSTMRTQLGYTLSHTSNVGFVKPNYGANLFGGYAQIIYTPASFNKRNNKEVKNNNIESTDKKFAYRIRATYGFSEFGKGDGPIRPVYSLQPQITYTKKHKYKWFAGLNTEYNTKLMLDIINTNQKIENKKWASTGIYGTMGSELLLGQFSIPLQIDLYIKRPIYASSFMTQRFGVLYYPSFYRNNSYKGISLGLMMKSENITADFIEAVATYNF